EQQVETLIHQHQGALLFLKSGTDQDKQFQLAIAEVKPPLRGKAGVVTVSPRQGKRLVNEENLPALIVFDAHGQKLYQFIRQLDREILNEVVYQLASHHH
ncbi:MAG: hypothetical protein NC911_10105, partial [Candidatus Omnitrophica bacterium]|nr:hypothetical protein [Candidatus Omnitrophota bacterium]